MRPGGQAPQSLECNLNKLHNCPVPEKTTEDMNGSRPFEERVFARFDAVDSGLKDLDARMQKLEARNYDTKPIWEQALKEIMETRRELSKRLDRIEAIAH